MSYNNFKSTTVRGSFQNLDYADGSITASSLFQRDVSISGTIYGNSIISTDINGLSLGVGKTTGLSQNVGIAGGLSSNLTGNQNISIGYNSFFGCGNPYRNVGIGSYSMASTSDRSGCVALGYSSKCYMNYGVALGYSSSISGLNSIAIGGNSIANFDNSIAFGYGVSTTSSGEIMLGDLTQFVNIPNILKLSSIPNVYNYITSLSGTVNTNYLTLSSYIYTYYDTQTNATANFNTLSSLIYSVSGNIYNNYSTSSYVYTTYNTITNATTNFYTLSSLIYTISGNVNTYINSSSGLIYSLSGNLNTYIISSSGLINSISGKINTISGYAYSISGNLNTLSGYVSSISGSLTPSSNISVNNITSNNNVIIQTGGASSGNVSLTIKTGDALGTVDVNSCSYSLSNNLGSHFFNTGIAINGLIYTNNNISCVGNVDCASINSINAYYYDPTSSIQSQFDSFTTQMTLFTTLYQLKANPILTVTLTADNTATTFYIPFTSNAASSGLKIDPTTTPLSYVPSTSTLTASVFSGNATNVVLTADNTATTFYIPFTSNAASSSLRIDPTTTPLSYVPSTSTLTASVFSGNATTSTTSTNSNNINLANDITTATTYIPFSSTATGNSALKSNANLKFNASTSNLSCTTFTGALVGNASSASQVNINSSDTNVSYYIPFVSASGNQNLYIDDTTTPSLKYNPNGSQLSCDNIVGANLIMTGNITAQTGLISQGTVSFNNFITNNLSTQTGSPSLPSQIGWQTSGSFSVGGASGVFPYPIGSLTAINIPIFGTGGLTNLTGSNTSYYGMYKIIFNISLSITTNASMFGIVTIGSSQATTTSIGGNKSCWSYNSNDMGFNNACYGQVTAMYPFYNSNPLYIACVFNSYLTVNFNSYVITRVS